MNISGKWFKANSSRQYHAQLSTHGERYVLSVDIGVVVEGSNADLKVSHRVGSIPRRIKLADGSEFVTEANDTLDQWLESSGHKAGKMTLFHHLESGWSYVVVAILVITMVIFSVFRWGIPAMSKQIAFALPAEANTYLAGKTLEVLDEILLEPSALKQEVKAVQLAHFHQNVAPLYPDPLTYTLHFRRMPKYLGGEGSLPNAMALPSGDIIVTDALVEQLTQDQMDAIVLHEMGHVVHRHSLRQVIESSSIMVLILITTGSTSAVETIVSALPAYILESHYSRDFELEADEFALKALLANGKDPAVFGVALGLISGHEHAVKKQNWSSLGKYFSSHPVTSERIEQAQEYARRHRLSH